MGFLHPQQLFWILAVVAVALCYVLWGRRRRQQTTTAHLWKAALARRSAWSRWRRAVSLLLAVFFVVLVVVALAQPFFASTFRTARTIVLIVDTTASMNATDVQPTRLSAAREKAATLVESLGEHEEMAVFSAGSAVRVHLGLTADRSQLLSAVREIRPTDGSGAMHKAVQTAQRLLAGRANPLVVVISDGAFAGAEQIVAADEVQLLQIGGAADNVAITRFAIRPHPGLTSAGQLFLELANFGGQSLTANVKLKLNEKLVQEIPLTLPPDKSARRTIPIDLSQAGLWTAELAPADALAADNRAQALVPGRPARRVKLVTPQDDTPVELALRSLPGIELDVSRTIPEDYTPRDISIFVGDVPPRLPAGPMLVFAPKHSTDAWEFVGQIPSPVIVDQQQHPTLHDVRLDEVLIDKASRLRFKGQMRPLATMEDGDPLYAAIDRPEGSVLVLAFDPVESDLHLRGDLPRLIGQAVSWLSDASATLPPRSTRDVLRLPPAQQARQLRSPYGDTKPFAAGVPLVANLSQAGVWVVEAAEASEHANAEMAIAVNLLDAEESDLRRAAKIKSDDLPMAPRRRGRQPWTWLVAAALVVIVTEWLLYQREVTV